ncbi:MAG: multidrug effflux MFS transporter [Alphaproteobacteria bacterium]|nr:multidrug effflux MFS transporter [Alphaproteobacteria bacterium]
MKGDLQVGTSGFMIFLVLVAMSSLGPVALNIFLPSMPGMEDAFGVDHTVVYHTLTFYLISMSISQLFVGGFSDRYGRRSVALLGTFLFFLTSLLCVFASSIGELIVLRVFQAVGACAGIVLSRAIISDLYDREKAASLLGYVTMGMAFAPMVAPMIGVILDQMAGWRGGFYFVSIMGFFLFFLLLYHLPETHIVRHVNASLPRQLFSEFYVLLRDPAFICFALFDSMGLFCFFAFVTGAPLILADLLHAAPYDYGLYFPLILGGYIFGSFLSGGCAVRFGINPLLVLSLFFLLGGVFFLWLLLWKGVGGSLGLFIPMMLVAASNGLSRPGAMASAMSLHRNITGAGSGLIGFLQLGCGALATFLVSFFYNGSYHSMVAAMGVASISAIFFLFLAILILRFRLRLPLASEEKILP